MVAKSHCIKIEQPVEPEIAEDSIFNLNLDLFCLCELRSVALIISSDPEWHHVKGLSEKANNCQRTFCIVARRQRKELLSVLKRWTCLATTLHLKWEYHTVPNVTVVKVTANRDKGICVYKKITIMTATMVMINYGNIWWRWWCLGRNLLRWAKEYSSRSLSPS